MTISLLPQYILTTISDPQGRGNASLLLDHTNKKIILEEIGVEAQYRGMKLGSRLLSQVCWLADSLGFTVVLVPVSLDDPVFTKCLTIWQLEGWYERYGFCLRDEYSDGYPYLREPRIT
jgi:GNAT superfamily N-acetyltransferase